MGPLTGGCPGLGNPWGIPWGGGVRSCEPPLPDGVHFVGRGGIDLTPVSDHWPPAGLGSGGGPHFDGTGDVSPMRADVCGGEKDESCLADGSIPGF